MNYDQTITNSIRHQIFKLCYEKKGGHIASSLSMVEIILAIFLSKFKYKKDRFLLSSCQGALALYSVQEIINPNANQMIDKFLSENSEVTMFPNIFLDFSDMTSGSLGHGISLAVGIGIHKKNIANLDEYIYVVIGDGELNEGSNWEGLMAAAHFSLDNIIIIVNYNGVQIDGKTNEIMNLEPLINKFISFGCNVIEVDGHNVSELVGSIENIKKNKNSKPSIIIAKTIKGNGVDICIEDTSWHYRIPVETEMEYFSKVLGS